MRVPPLDGFELFWHADGRTKRPVYWTGNTDAPPVVLLHELPGLIPECIDLARRLHAEGFCIYMPLLFGRPEPGPIESAAYTALICIRREFTLFATGRPSPIADWVRLLCHEASERCGGQKVGVIGMCLTGGFGLLLAVDPIVDAPVLSQPSLPLPLSARHRRDLGLDPDGLSRLDQRVSEDGLEILGMRFTGDRLCPPERFDELQRRYGERFLRIDIDSSPGNPWGYPLWAHSVLTIHYDDTPGTPTRQAYETMLSFLRRRLTGNTDSSKGTVP